MGMFLGLCAFWNGAAVIGGLLILCGFAIFSDGKVDYAVMAGVSIFFSWLQSKIFIVGSAMSSQIYLGFLAEDKTVPGVVKYLFWMSGVFSLAGTNGMVYEKTGESNPCEFPVSGDFCFCASDDTGY